jgi:hypothetical protein
MRGSSVRLIAMWRQHIEQLIERHNITRHPEPIIDNARSSHANREIWIPQVQCKLSYVAALHEIGHILGEHQQSRHIMVRERWAWRWARRNSLTPWGPILKSYVQAKLDRYRHRAPEYDRALQELQGAGSSSWPSAPILG